MKRSYAIKEHVETTATTSAPPLPYLQCAFSSCSRLGLQFLTMNPPGRRQPHRSCADAQRVCGWRQWLWTQTLTVPGTWLEIGLWKGKVFPSHRETLFTGAWAFLWVNMCTPGCHCICRCAIWFTSKPWLSWKLPTPSQRCLCCWRKWTGNILGPSSIWYSQAKKTNLIFLLVTRLTNRTSAQVHLKFYLSILMRLFVDLGNISVLGQPFWPGKHSARSRP